ncbi:MAG TPA: iron-containing alcohol dehydrogenase [Streptosporangiaceae bacterium]
MAADLASSGTAPPAWAYTSAGRVIFGRGVVHSAGRLAAQAGSTAAGSTALVCTDTVLVAAGLLDPVLASLSASGLEVTVFDGGEPEVGRATVEEAARMASSKRPGLLIGLGGGSNIDLAKGVATLLAHGGDLDRYYGDSAVPGEILPVMAIPTTAGTGSEVSPVAVFADDARRMKVGVSSAYLVPRWALVDPLLTVSCPPSVTAHSGMDALSHAIEALCALAYTDTEPDASRSRAFCGKNPYSDTLALEAVSLIGRSLTRAYRDGGDLQAREDMMLASMFAGLAFAAAGTGLVHALQYPIGALTKTPHGLGNALLLPAVMRFNRPARAAVLAQVGRWLPGQSASLPDEAAADQAPGQVAALAAALGIRGGLAALGVGAADIAPLAADAATVTRLIQLNPRPVTTADLEAVLRDALEPTAG